jgi:Ceramidase
LTITARQTAIAAAMTLLSAAAIWLLLSALGPNWALYAPASCTTTHCFCEFPRPGALMVQPANSISSFGYAFGGFLMIVLASASGWGSAFPRSAARIFGATAIFVGLGSVLLHATLTLWGQFFDVMGMYLVSGFMLVSAFAAWRGLSNRSAMALYVIVLLFLIAVLALFPEVRRWLYAVVLIGAIILELGFARPRRIAVQTGYYLAGIGAKATAFAIWTLDQRGLVCAPDSLIQGHAAWHLLGATALWLTFLYYRSEQPRMPVHPG